MEKSYQKVIHYIKKNILEKKLVPGDRLLAERDLAEQLDTSRNSVREGLRILENMGVICSFQGAGNFIASNFDETLTEVMSFMYVLKDMDMDSITEFRYTLEWQAMNLAAERATPEQKKKMLEHLDKLEAAGNERMRVLHDKAIHYLLIETTKNHYMITNYRALTNIMDQYIPKMRGKIIEGMKSEDLLCLAHRMLVEGVVEGDHEKGMKGLEMHFKYINQFKD